MIFGISQQGILKQIIPVSIAVMLALSNIILTIPGYSITEQIYSGSKTLVYRGIREQDQKGVIIKLLRNEYPTFSEISQFRNQYTITQNLNLPGIIKPLSLENYGNSYALVMEDCGGISLKDWQQAKKHQNGNAITLQEFFHIATEIASTLEGLHRDRIIHKDIKPANIIIHPTTFEVRLIDFSIATLLPREIQFLTNPNVLEGTLAYISPEQTGRMNRGIDYRSDFYSLGVTLFELLTGELPFVTADPIELVYCHIAKHAPTASQVNSNIPSVLSAIISKLMAKNAEDRYQSAHGLRHDLEECRQQWQQTGKITNFELAQKDISNRFLIPEKLYGRQSQVENLLATFARVSNGTTEMILVAGFSGIGKTAVVNEIHKPIVRERSYFIKGKYDQFQRDIPFCGFVQAFRDLIGQILLETDQQIQQWKNQILLALGEQGQVIIDVIPELELIIGQQPEIIELTGSAAENRFNLLLQRFIHVFMTREHPLVIFLDDLQWADAASLTLMQLLMNETNKAPQNMALSSGYTSDKSLLIIGAYRDNEVAEGHPLYLTIEELKNTKAAVNTITLTPLTESDLNCLIADTLRCPEKQAIAQALTCQFALTRIIFAKTKGNPFFTHEFLKALYKDGIFEFNFDLGSWQYDLGNIQALALTDDVVEFMTTRLMKLPTPTQDVLKLAACIGNQFDLKTLAMIYDKSTVDTASDLWTALVEGLVIPQNESYKLVGKESPETTKYLEEKESTHGNSQLPKYSFIHDRVQQAAYSLIPKREKQLIHLKIGQLLLKNTSVIEREEIIFELVNQFNIAIPLINLSSDRLQLAEMNLLAGRKALASTAYPTALKYFTTGIKLLTDDSWETQYEFTLTFYEIAAEAAYLAGNFQQMEKLTEVALQKVQSLFEKVKLYEIKIQAYGAQNQALAAVNIGLSFLKLLGVEFPENASESDVQLAMAETTSNLTGRRIEDFIDLPEMTAVQTMAIMPILSSVSSLAYQTNPHLFLLIILKQINLSIQYGNMPLSAYVYVSYGFLLCSLGNIESGYEFGNLALNLLIKQNTEKFTAKTVVVFNSAIRHWKEHARENFQPLLDAYAAGLETGDLEHAAYALFNYTYGTYYIGKKLAGLQQEVANYSHAICQIKQQTAFYWHEIYRQNILNLVDSAENPCRLVGEAYDEEKMLPIHIQGNDIMGLFHLYVSKLFLCYLFEDFSEAVENGVLAEKYLDGGAGQLVVPIFHFYDSLAHLAIYADATDEQQKNILARVQVNQEKMLHWANHSPMNFLHKYYLVEAERQRLFGENLAAMDNYERAISLAKENKYLNEEALANELAAKFYFQWGKDKIAQLYMNHAYYGYIHWGALAKAEHLQTNYPQLLAPILQPEKLKLSASNSQITDISISQSIPSTNETVISSNASQSSVSDMLDLASVIKASQALSGAIELEQLLSTLMAVVMENAGASKCVLILSEGDHLNLTVTAVSSSANLDCISTEFPSTQLESSTDVPITLINYIKRTKEIFVIDDVKTVAFLTGDRYIVREQPKSLLCVPVINQGKLLGILYLENNLTTGAFTRDRVEVLKLLTTQAAISLENSLLYTNLASANQTLEEYNHNLEEKVEQRTQEINENNQRLQQALLELQSTQTRLIQSEKMSSLGEMVAGVAHEINNPINFIHGNINHASDYVQDLLDLIVLYQQEYPDTSDIIEEKAAEIDVDFLAQDLPKILNSMKVGSSRIRNIVLGLRNFSRLDESEMKPVDIHEGIDNTLMILQHRLKEKSDRSEIAVIKQYAELPQVNCYAGQLNQVFMNILSNAIDALEESIVNQKITDKPQIHISTERGEANTLRIRIGDNGYGMNAQVCQKIFDPFFTTKPIGSGTGLGLSISYQVVVDKHKGQLTCNSTPGKGTEFVIEIPMQK